MLGHLKGEIVEKNVTLAKNEGTGLAQETELFRQIFSYFSRKEHFVHFF
jgi:hypothetical protein